MGTVAMLDKEARIYRAGRERLAGSPVVRNLSKRGFNNIVGVTSQGLDKADAKKVGEFAVDVNADVLIGSTAKTREIQDKTKHQPEFLQENLEIRINRRKAAHHPDVAELISRLLMCLPEIRSSTTSERLFLARFHEGSKS